MTFRSKFSEARFIQKYAHAGCETWDRLARTLADDVMLGLLPVDIVDEVYEIIRDMWFIPGGRYLWYAGRPLKAYNNCFLFKSEEDNREDWARISWQAESALMTGGGIGNEYSIYRPKGTPLARTGGVASGPIPKMMMTNEIGRFVMQGGSRRSAIWAGLNWQHGDIHSFLKAKDWYAMPVGNTGFSFGQVKEQDFNFAAPLDMTNISVGYDTAWLEGERLNDVFVENVRQALKTGEPGFSFNFGTNERAILRNACCEVVSEDDSDVCNLGSINLARVPSITEMSRVTALATLFLLCGTIRGVLPYDKVYQVRDKNRRLGLGLMGVHEWLLQRLYRYEMNDELRDWLHVYKEVSDQASKVWANYLNISHPIANRAIAPTGTISIMAGTTSGIEPVFAAAYRRRFLRNGTDWHYSYVVEPVADMLVADGIDPDGIETALTLADDFERRISFQADVQDYVDMAISSTVNLPAWDTPLNNEDTVLPFATVLAKYAPRLRGLTVYPDGSRGGQPLTVVPYNEAKTQLGVEYKEHDSCKGGVCGL